MKITSEEPNDHWYFLKPNGKIVLDLGCNKFYSSISTAQWFIENGAEKLIGVDLTLNDYSHENYISHIDVIDSTFKIENLLKYNPQLIKSDIEGAEVYFEPIQSLPSVEEIAIEYHSEHLKGLMERKLKEWGFENIITYQIFNEDINRIGVLHAWK